MPAVPPLTIAGGDPAMSSYQFRVNVDSPLFQSSAASLIVEPPTVIYVNGNANIGGDGASWASAFRSLEDALSSVNSCKREIWVARGTYFPTNDFFSIPKDAQLFGGFLGTETSRNQRNISGNPVHIEQRRKRG